MNEENRKTDSELWTEKLIAETLEEIANAKDEEKEEKQDEYGIFECLNCGEIIDENITKPNKKLKYSERLKCPKCGRRKFKKITKEKKEQIIRKRKKAEENEKKEMAASFADDMQDDIKDLFDDLENKLKNKEITPERFVALFYNISCKIISYYDKAYRKQNFASFVDWPHEQKLIYEMGQTVLDLYELKEDQEKIIDSYETEKDEVYRAYLSKYEYGQDEEFKEYKDNATLGAYIKSIARRQVAEERAQRRAEQVTEKIASKDRVRAEESFKESLAKNINKL